jgi:hypothetical protein
VRNLRSIAWAPGARYALVVAAVALLGLLSMHGWGTHAGMHPFPRTVLDPLVRRGERREVGVGLALVLAFGREPQGP